MSLSGVPRVTQIISKSNPSKTDIKAVSTPRLHDTVSTNLIQASIHRITVEYFANSPFQFKPQILQTGNYTFDDRIYMPNKYKHIGRNIF